MAGAEESNLLLTPFAPLIQLWAGICLLFFYETLFKHSPLSGKVDKLKKLHEKFRLKYIDFIPHDKLMDDNEFASDKWEEYTLPTIKNIAALTFFYCVFILTYIGIEDSYGIKREYAYALQPINIMVLLYVGAASTLIKCKLFHSYWTPTCAIILIVLYFHFFLPINEFFITHGCCLGDFWSLSWINVVTLFTLFSGIVLVAIRIASIGLSLWLKKRSVEKLDSNCKDLWAVRMKVKKLEDLPKPLLQKIQPELNKKFGDNIIDTSEALLDCMKKEIAAEYTALNIKWWQNLTILVSDSIKVQLTELFSIIETDNSSSEE